MVSASPWNAQRKVSARAEDVDHGSAASAAEAVRRNAATWAQETFRTVMPSHHLRLSKRRGMTA